MLSQNASSNSAPMFDVQMQSGKVSDDIVQRGPSIPLRIPGSWSVKVTFLTSSGPDIPGTRPHWWIAVFTGISSISPEISYVPAPPNILIVRSNQDTHSMGTWNASSADTATFSLVMQMFQAGVWKGNLNIYAPELLISSESNTFTTPSTNPVQAVQYDTSGIEVGQASISLVGTRIPIAAADMLPIQS
jgi:hypothetical protein